MVWAFFPINVYEMTMSSYLNPSRNPWASMAWLCLASQEKESQKEKKTAPSAGYAKSPWGRRSWRSFAWGVFGKFSPKTNRENPLKNQWLEDEHVLLAKIVLILKLKKQTKPSCAEGLCVRMYIFCRKIVVERRTMFLYLDLPRGAEWMIRGHKGCLYTIP